MLTLDVINDIHIDSLKEKYKYVLEGLYGQPLSSSRQGAKGSDEIQS